MICYLTNNIFFPWPPKYPGRILDPQLNGLRIWILIQDSEFADEDEVPWAVLDTFLYLSSPGEMESICSREKSTLQKVCYELLNIKNPALEKIKEPRPTELKRPSK